MAKPTECINEADAIERYVLLLSRVQHHESDEIVNQHEHGELLEDVIERFRAENVQTQCLFQVPEICLNGPALAVQVREVL